MTSTFTVQSNNPDAEDRKGFREQITIRNEAITAQNVAITAANNATTPPGTTPLIPLLPLATNNEQKASAEIVYAQTITNAHVGYVQAALVSEKRLTDAQKIGIKTAVNALLDSGQTYTQILAKLA